MNSHAVNLQTSGHQSVVVGHHRGFSQPSTVTSGGDPWFLQAHEMPPTAPARHHKRPAPQPGSILHNNNNNNVGSQSNHQLSQLQHHHSAVSVVALNLTRLSVQFEPVHHSLFSHLFTVNKHKSATFVFHRTGKSTTEFGHLGKLIVINNSSGTNDSNGIECPFAQVSKSDGQRAAARAQCITNKSTNIATCKHNHIISIEFGHDRSNSALASERWHNHHRIRRH